MFDDLPESRSLSPRRPKRYRCQFARIVPRQKARGEAKKLPATVVNQDRDNQAITSAVAALGDRHFYLVDVFRSGERSGHKREKNIGAFELFLDTRIPVIATQWIAIIKPFDTRIPLQ